MSIEVINEALELLRIAQSGMGPDPGYLDRYDRHHWDRISKCREGLEKLKQQETAAHVPAAVPEALTQEPLRGDEPIGPQASRADYVRGWNACRNAMLSAAPQPAVTADVAKDSGIAGFKSWPATHLKSGNEYRVIGEAIDATNATEGRTMVIYRGNGHTFVREAGEFTSKFAAMKGGER